MFSPASGMLRSESVFVVGGLDAAGTVMSVRNISIEGASSDDKFVVDISKPQLSPWNVRVRALFGASKHMPLLTGRMNRLRRESCFLAMSQGSHSQTC